MIYLDYSVPIEAIRSEVQNIIEQSALWDREVVMEQVTDFHSDVMEVRILASSSNAGRAFDLRCEIREKLAAFLQECYPSALPRFRAELVREKLGPASARHVLSTADQHRQPNGGREQ
jgi:hypothetical protein